MTRGASCACSTFGAVPQSHLSRAATARQSLAEEAMAMIPGITTHIPLMTTK